MRTFVLAVSALALLTPNGAQAQDSVSEQTPDDLQVLVSKDIGGERWAITRNDSDLGVLGNVFGEGDGAPTFLDCTDLSDEIGAGPDDLFLECYAADRCALAPCPTSDWTLVDVVELPRSFFDPGPLRTWDSVGPPIALPRSFFAPPSSPDDDRSSGARRSRDGERILINKDVGVARWAITRNLAEGTVTGNVFSGDSGEVEFIWCEEIPPPADAPAEDITLDCYVPGDLAPTPTPEPTPPPSPTPAPTPSPTPRPAFTTAEYLGPYLCQSKWPGAFLHVAIIPGFSPDKTGTCFRCPSGYSRTVLPLHMNEACQKGFIIGREFSAPEELGKIGCEEYGATAFRNLTADECFRCPAGYARSAEIDFTLRGNPRACEQVN